MPPVKAKKPCRKFGCKALTTNINGYCDEHQEQVLEKVYDRFRGTPSSRGYDWTWVNFRKRYLRQHPLCVQCEAKGEVTPASEIHHIKPLKEGGAKFEESNLAPLCHECHSRITFGLEAFCTSQ